MLSEPAQKLLLRLARDAVRARIVDGVDSTASPPALGDVPDEVAGELDDPDGAFVTLRRREDHALRGCIGYVEAVRPLRQAVPELAVSAATRDGRFEPVAPEEVGGLTIEVSVLSPLQPVGDPAEIEVGVHGLVVRQDGRSGLLLPQVATEQGWDRSTFLAQTCRKARLPEDAWRAGADVLRFTAQVFSESTLGVGGGLPSLAGGR